MKYFCLIYFNLFVCLAFGQAQQKSDLNYDSLLNSSDAIILEDVLTINVPNEFSADYTVYRKILLKNNKASEFCKVVLNESHFKKIEDIQAGIYEPKGKLIRELDSDDINEAQYSAEHFYSGDKYKYFEMQHHTYPYIFEYKYKVELKTLLLWPDWYPQYSIPNRSSSYKLIINPAMKFRYYQKGLDLQPYIKEQDGLNVYLWRLRDLPKNINEDFLAPEDKIQKAVYFVPEFFHTDNYQGSAESWLSYARWYNRLTNGRYDLSEPAKAEVFEIIKDVNDPVEKIKLLYKHLQKKNRYVAIEMGLAGWQPQPADQVFRNRYGDCKDLSTYMISMLNTVGIKSYPALALTRDDGLIVSEQPSNQFNHCIVYVPLEKDTFWLECTSTYNEMENVPHHIEDIDALVIEENSGEIIRTPQKSSDKNRMTSLLKATLNTIGDLKFEASVKTTGNQKYYLYENLVRLNSKDDEVFIIRSLSRNYSNLELSKLEIDEKTEGADKDFKFFANGVYNKFIPQMSERIFITPGILNRKTVKDLPKESVAERKYPVFFFYPYEDIDSVYIAFPRGYNMESKPKNQQLENELFSYSTEFDFRDGQLFYLRSFRLKKNYIPLNDYPLFYETLKKIIDLDKSKFVLKKN